MPAVQTSEFPSAAQRCDSGLEMRDYSQISRTMESWTPEQILAWAIDEFGSKLAFATAFGVEGCTLIAMMSQIAGFRRAYLFNLDTGYQFEETMALRDTMMEKYDLKIHLVRSDESVPSMETRFGGPIYGKDPDTCCHIRKVIPLNKVVAGYDAWISSIRRDQSPTRATAPIVHWDKKFNLVKINPLANWSRKDVWSYIFKNEVPYNPLHDQGFTSIGCMPCTRAVEPGEDERAGRWANFTKKECGIHVPNFQI
jgi:phosphoadenosine phosphosulfate reductase